MKLKLILIFIFGFYAIGFGQGRLIKVNSVFQLETAVKNILSGDTIEVADGTYNFGGNISIDRRGDKNNNVTIRACE